MTTGIDGGPTAADIYREQRAHHGRMHDTMYAMPPSFAVVIGALWFFGAQQLTTAPFISALVFTFSAFTSQYLFRAYTIFAKRTEEMRLMLQDKETGHAFDYDQKQIQEGEYNQPKKLWAGLLDFICKRDEVTHYRDPVDDARRHPGEPKGIQAKTREQFRVLMRGAGVLSLAGALYSVVLLVRQIVFCWYGGLWGCLAPAAAS